MLTLRAIQRKGSIWIPRQQPQARPIFTSLKHVFSKKPVKIPKPRPVTNIQTHHGRQREDSFSWMENLSDQHINTYIQAENDYTKQMMRQHKFLEKIILREMKRKLQVPNALPPLKTVSNGYEYYSTTSSYGMVYLRKKLGEGRDAPEQVLLNTGFLRSMNMGVRKVLLSPDHSLFAYNTEREGMEYGELHFKDLNNSSEWAQNEVLGNVFNFVWANNRVVYYTVPNEQLRPFQVYAHLMGTDQSEDILVFEEPDDTVFVDITCSKDNKFIHINANTLSSSEVRVVSTDHNFSKSSKPLVQLIEPRVPGIEYYVDHHHDTFYILTNADGATNFKLVKTSDHTLQRKYWQDVVTMKATEKIEDVDLFQRHIIVYGKRDGLPMMLCHDLVTHQTHSVKLPEKFCVLYPGTNLDFHTDQVRFSIQSPFMHESTFEYDMSTQKLSPVRVQPVKNFDKSNYTCSQVHVPSHDGKKVPVTLLHKKEIKLNGKNPVLMRSYGAYGTCTDIDFRVEQFPLLERGWVIALPHVRGGSELGRDWYEEGKLKNKMNSFKDFIAVAEHLVDSKLTSPEHLTAMGTSAGGLLVGAMLHMRPDLFKALLLKVPFVDPLSAMLDPSLPLTQIEYPEWGNPTDDPEAYDLIESYAPYDNIHPHLFSDHTSFPSVYITGGMKDQRVAYWQPLKLMARLRHSMPAQYPSTALLQMDLDRGHFSGAEQESRLSDLAQQMAFLITQVNTK